MVKMSVSYNKLWKLLVDKKMSKADLRRAELDERCENNWKYNQQEMYERLHSCYTQMADKYNLDLIPSGSVIQAVRKLPEFCVPDGGLTLCRDGFHMSFDYGRYAAALLWCAVLGMENIEGNTFVPPYVDIRCDRIDAIKKAVTEIVG